MSGGDMTGMIPFQAEKDKEALLAWKELVSKAMALKREREEADVLSLGRAHPD